MKRLKWLCACIPLCFTFGGVAYANPSSGQTLEEVQQRKMEVEQQLESTNRTIGNIDKNYETLTAELQKIDGTMQDLELQKYELLSDIIFAKNEVYNLGKDKKELEEKIEKRKKISDERLRSLQLDNSSTSYISAFFESDNLLDFIDRAQAVKTFIEMDEMLIEQLEEDVANYDSLVEERQLTLDSLQSTNQKLKETESSLLEEQNKKQIIVDMLDDVKADTLESKVALESEQEQIEEEEKRLIAEKSQNQASFTSPYVPVPNNEGVSMGAGSYNFDVRNMTGVTVEQIDSILTGKLSGYGAKYHEVGLKHGINPAFLAAISMAETGGTAIDSRNNIGGFMKKSGGKMSFNSIDDSIEYMGLLLTRLYIGDGLVTVEQIHTRYSPVGASNDPTNLNSNWVRNVYAAMQRAGVPV